MRKTFEYRLYPNRRQRELLMGCLIESRLIYNEMLEQVRDHNANTGKFLSGHELCKRFKGRSGDYVPASTVQTLARRLDKALWYFVKRRKRGERAGFPRFKSPNRWHSIQLRQYGREVRLEQQRLKVPGKLGKSIKVKRHRPLQGTPKTAYLKLRADGHWYVLVVCDLGEPPPVALDRSTIGLDVGLKAFLADSEGEIVENPRHHRKGHKALRRARRRLSRRKKGSNRRKKAARALARAHLKIARRRKDFLHKIARLYVEQYSTIVVEDLNVAGMSKNPYLAKHIADASWSKFIEILESKAEEAGSRVEKVAALHTTQLCSACGDLVPKSLSVRTHHCSRCGFVADRDVNAAKNILSAWTGPSEQNVTGSRERAPRSRC